MRLNRILMNEEGSSPGGGVPPVVAPATPPASPGATPPAEPAVPISQLKTVIGEVFGELRNGLFADLRKAGALGKEKPVPEPSAAAPASPGLSMADVEAFVSRDRVLTRVEIENKLTVEQSGYMRAALKEIDPSELPAKAASYLTAMGLAKGAEPTPSTPAAAVVAVPASGPPISDKGSPAPGSATNWEREYAENPIGMSPAARAAMDAKYGVEKARRMRVEAAQRQGENIRVTATPQR